MPDPKDKITTENIGEFAKSVGLPVLGVVPHEEDMEAFRLATFSSGGTLRTLEQEFYRDGALEIGKDADE